MTKRGTRLAAVLILVLIAGLSAGCGENEPQEPEARGPTVTGLTLLNDRCTECHTLDRVQNASMTREQWNETVEDMIDRGAELDEREKELLVEYLAQQYGP
jgi:hypothetical protein